MSGRRVTILDGPNLDRLGTREPDVYGDMDYASLQALCRETAADLGLELTIHQTDAEGDLVRLVHEAAEAADGLILNAAAYTHTSVALRDALLCHDLPIIEVHLSNPDAREPFRRTNLIADVVTAGVRGFGARGYVMALQGLAVMVSEQG